MAKRAVIRHADTTSFHSSSTLLVRFFWRGGRKDHQRAGLAACLACSLPLALSILSTIRATCGSGAEDFGDLSGCGSASVVNHHMCRHPAHEARTCSLGRKTCVTGEGNMKGI